MKRLFLKIYKHLKKFLKTFSLKDICKQLLLSFTLDIGDELKGYETYRECLLKLLCPVYKIHCTFFYPVFISMVCEIRRV